jgi:hypothetical protein
MEYGTWEDDWRNKLDAVWRRYQIDRNPGDKQEFLKLLKQFSDLINRGKGSPIHDK